MSLVDVDINRRTTRDLYTTTFSQTENPVFEGGVWYNEGLDWTNVATSGGLAICTQTGDEGGDATYRDSTAHLWGFPANHRVEITLHRDGTTIGGNQEVECLLRWSASPHVTQGYECLLPHSGSGYGVQVVRWNGPLADYTYLAEFSPPSSIAEGDRHCAQIVGNIITVSYIPASTGIEAIIGTVDITSGDGADLVYANGNPGLGLFRQNMGSTNTFPSAYCATGFLARGLQ